MNKLRVVSWIAVLSLLSFGAFTGCSDDDNDTTFTGPTSQDEDDDDAGRDTDGDHGGDLCDDVQCDEGQLCVDGECRQAGLGVSCVEPRLLDVSGDQTQTITANPAGEPNVVQTNCSDGSTGQSVFTFSVDEPTRIFANVIEEEHMMVKELREGVCEDATAAIECSHNRWNTVLEPGVDYYLIVEALDDFVGNYELELRSEQLVCSPPGEWSCDGDDITQCFAGDELREYECVDGCLEGQCVGDSCTNPLEVTESKTVTADLKPYNGRINFADSPSCSSSGSGASTSGEELVFSLPGLTEGQQVDVQAPDISWAIGIMDHCDEQSPECVAADTSSGQLNWTVESDGDYFVVVNRFSSSADTVDFVFDITD